MHKNEAICQSCELKLKDGHPKIVELYRWVKEKHIDAHVCWVFRGQADQDSFYFRGASKEMWPHSKHNYMENSVPMAKAIDIFRLDSNGHAVFEDDFYRKLWDEIQTEPSLSIRWGGIFHDNDHYELKE